MAELLFLLSRLSPWKVTWAFYSDSQLVFSSQLGSLGQCVTGDSGLPALAERQIHHASTVAGIWIRRCEGKSGGWGHGYYLGEVYCWTRVTSSECEVCSMMSFADSSCQFKCKPVSSHSVM